MTSSRGHTVHWPVELSDKVARYNAGQSDLLATRIRRLEVDRRREAIRSFNKTFEHIQVSGTVSYSPFTDYSR